MAHPEETRSFAVKDCKSRCDLDETWGDLQGNIQGTTTTNFWRARIYPG